MAGTISKGTDGVIRLVGGAEVPCLREWTLEATTTLSSESTPCMASNGDDSTSVWATVVAVGRAWSLSLTFLWQKTDEAAAPSFSPERAGERLDIEVLPIGSSGEIYSGNAIIQSVTLPSDIGTAITQTVNLVGDDDLYYGITPAISGTPPSALYSIVGDEMHVDTAAWFTGEGHEYTANALPAGFALDIDTGLITGTLTAAAAPLSVTVTADNGVGQVTHNVTWNTWDAKADAKGWFDVNQGKLAAKFDAIEAQYLGIADAGLEGLDLGGPCSFSAWVRFPVDGTIRGILGKYQTSGSNLSYRIRKTSSNFFEFTVSANGSTTSTVVSSALATNDWQFIVCVYDGSTIGISVDGSVISTAAHSSGIYNGLSEFSLGAYDAANYANGDMMKVGVWDRALDRQDINFLYNQGEPQDIPDEVDTGLVSYWPLDEKSGTRFDRVGKNHLLDVNGVGSTVAPKVVHRTVARFDSANNEALFAYYGNHDVDFSGDFTVSLWINPTALSGTQWVMSRGAGSTVLVGVSVYLSGSQAVARVVTQNGFSAVTIGLLEVGTWAHVIVQRVGSQLRTYKDNVAAISVTALFGSADASSGSLSLGAFNAGSAHFNGLLAHFALWETALSAAEITTLYNNGTMQKIPASFQGVSYWPLCEKAGVRHDYWSDNHLSDNNSVNWTSGQTDTISPAVSPVAWSDTVASFTAANSEYLSRDDAQLSGVDVTQPFTVVGWVKTTARTSNNALIAKWALGGFRLIQIASTGQWRFYSQNTANVISIITSPTIPADNTWAFLVAGYDGTNIFLSINGEASNTKAVVDIKATVAALEIGKQATTHDGQLAHIAFWGRALTPSDIATLYNGGDMSLAAINSVAVHARVACWPLWEPRGKRYNIWAKYDGENALDDNNTVGAAHGPVEYQAGEYAGITKWENQGLAASPFGDLYPIEPGAAPQLIGGKLVFDALSKGLQTSEGSIGSQPYTLVFVGSLAEARSSPAIFVDAETSTPVLIRKQNAAGYGIHAGSSLGDVPADTNTHVFVAVMDGASSEFYVDGQLEASGDAGSNVLSGFTLGSRFNGSTPHKGDAVAGIAFTRKLTSSEIQALTAYYA